MTAPAAVPDAATWALVQDLVRALAEDLEASDDEDTDLEVGKGWASTLVGTVLR